MAFAKHASLALCLWTTTFVAAASASAQSQTCADGSSLWSVTTTMATTSTEVTASVLGPVSLPSAVEAPALVPVPPSQDIQWCVDSEDPRCMPDPAGAPAAHLQHAGDVGQAALMLSVAAAPLAVIAWRDQASACVARGVVFAIERPPRSR